MSSTKDEDRRVAFKAIVDDIEADRERYQDIPSQVARIAELIDSQDLKFRPRNGEVQTPTAKVLRGALMEFIRRKGRNAATAGSVFTDGMRVLTQEQRIELGYPEEARTDAASSSRSQKAVLQQQAPEVVRPARTGDINSAQEQQSPWITGGRVSGAPRLSAPAADKQAPSRSISTRLGTETSTPLFSLPSSKLHPTAVLPLGVQLEPTMISQHGALQPNKDALRGIAGTQPISTLPEKRGIKRKHETGLEDGRPSKRSVPGADSEPAVYGTMSSEIDESMPAHRGTKRKHAAAHGDGSPKKRKEDDFGRESEANATSSIDGIASMLTPSSPTRNATAANTASQKYASIEKAQGSRSDAAILTATQPRCNESRRARTPQSGSPSTPQASVLNLAQVTTCYEYEPVEQSKTGSGSHTGPTQYPNGLNRVREMAQETEHIAIGIEGATSFLLKSSDMQDMRASIPTTPCDDLEELYRRVLCSPVLPWQPEATGLLSTNLSLHEWLSACVGAMIYEQVFLKPVPWRTPKQLLEDMKYAKPWFSKVLRALYEPKHDFQYLDYYVWRTGEQQIEEDSAFEAEHVTPVAEKLAARCMMLVVQQMKHAKPDVEIPQAGLKRAMSEYTALFKKAMFLRGRCEVAPSDFEYIWPAPRESFSSKLMKEIRGWDDNANEVQITLFPAVRAMRKSGVGYDYFAKAQVYCTLKSKGQPHS